MSCCADHSDRCSGLVMHMQPAEEDRPNRCQQHRSSKRGTVHATQHEETVAMSVHNPQTSPHTPSNQNGRVSGGQESRGTKRRSRPLDDDVVIVAVDSRQSSDAIRQLAEHAKVPVVVDLRELQTDRSGTAESLDDIVDATSYSQSEYGIVANRDDAIHVSAIAPVAVFTSIGDAIQSHRFAECGYGPGWTPSQSR